MCFATGSLLGEVFLHLLPESVGRLSFDSIDWALALLLGLVIFFGTEKLAGLQVRNISI